jgi:aminoglycoside phosphotransferase family enzyme/predicted kinase
MGNSSADSGEAKLPAFIRRMLEPDFYPHPTQTPIHLVQTHISYVLLTGDFAYKVKKPVNLGFVDFSTLGRRRHFCREELRLNQRGAPEVYVDVVRICQNGDDFTLGVGNEIDCAVKMRQLPENGMFNRMLERGALQITEINHLARRVAEYHANAPTSPRLSEFGRPDRIRQIIEDNYTQTRRFIGGPLTQDQFDQTRAFTDSFFDRRADLFEIRRQNGFVRECHGDLHLANVCQWNDQIVLFDCIEFNDSFRCIDVIQDAAFAAMDLQASGHPDFSTQFINQYVERTGDWDDLQLLPLYLCRHAYVRGKVNALLTTEPEVSDQSKQSALQKAAEYFRLARKYAEPTQGQILLVTGVSGSGKSTVASQLARASAALHIRSDAVRKHLTDTPLDAPAPPHAYDAATTDRTYARLLELGITLARSGFTVILDATYLRHTHRKSAIETAAGAGIPLRIISCTAPPHVLRARLSARTGDVSDAGPELLESQLRNIEDFDPSERSRLVQIDTTFEPQMDKVSADLKMLRKNS